MVDSTTPRSTRNPVSSLRKGAMRHISYITKHLAKRIVIGAYCRGWLNKEQTQRLFRSLGLGV